MSIKLLFTIDFRPRKFNRNIYDLYDHGVTWTRTETDIDETIMLDYES